MFRTADGDEIFVIDSHVHWWDGSPANQLNRHGAEFINCFHDYQKGLSPEEYHWTAEQFGKYTPEKMYQDLFANGYDDIAICQPTYLTDFYKNGFNTTEQNAQVKERYPNRYILNGAFDPRDEEKGLDYLESLVEKYKIKGVKLYTAEWKAPQKATNCRSHGRSVISSDVRSSAWSISTCTRVQRFCRSIETPSTWRISMMPPPAFPN